MIGSTFHFSMRRDADCARRVGPKDFGGRLTRRTTIGGLPHVASPAYSMIYSLPPSVVSPPVTIE